MRTNVFLDGEFANKRGAILAVLTEDTDNFGALVASAGLDPRQDFRFKNLDGVDFSHTDLRSFDFTGSSLKGATGVNAIWDETTVLVDAEYEGSIFDKKAGTGVFVEESPLNERFRAIYRKTWQEQIIWLDSINGDGNFNADFETAFDIYLNSEDTFVKRHALATIVKFLHKSVVLGFLCQPARLTPHNSRARAAVFHVLGIFVERDRREALRIALALLSTAWRDEAVAFLARHLLEDGAIRHLTDLVRRADSQVLRKRYVGALASRYGQPVSLMVRDPLTEDSADFGELIDADRIARVANVMSRRINDEARNGRIGSYLDEFETHQGETAVRLRILARLEMLNNFGLGFRLPSRREVSAYKAQRHRNNGP